MFVDRDSQTGVFSAAYIQGTHLHDVLIALLAGFPDVFSNGGCRLGYATHAWRLALGAWRSAL